MRTTRTATLAVAAMAIAVGGFAGTAGADSPSQPPACPEYVEADDDYPFRPCDKGPHVERIQRLLQTRGGVELPYYVDADGYFGPLTERAVREFQADHGLVVDGLVGPATWRALSATVVGGSDLDGSGQIDPWDLDNAPGGGCESYTLNFGTYPIDRCDSGLAVHYIQMALFNQYGYGIAIDGFFGRATESAVTDFQRRWGLPVTGVADEATMRAITEPYFGPGQDIDGDGVIEPLELVPAN